LFLKQSSEAIIEFLFAGSPVIIGIDSSQSLMCLLQVDSGWTSNLSKDVIEEIDDLQSLQRSRIVGIITLEYGADELP
jgi:hypothetical protein